MDQAGFRRLRWGIKYHLDRSPRPSIVVVGLFGSHAAFHDGLGCVLLQRIERALSAEERL